MSPEQARGAPVDKRTDIWAFGCVLYEMLTGHPAFAGPTMSDVIARILERAPDWEALPDKTPQPVRQLLRRCLEKDARYRLRDIGDALLELKDTLTAPALSKSEVPRSWRSVVLSGVVVTIAAAGIWAAFYRFGNSSSVGGQLRLSDGSRASANAEANAYYERSLLFGGDGTADPQQAERMIERALALDPKFAAARAEYAFSQVSRILNGLSNDPNLFYKAENEVRQALQDDPRCGRAHSVLGLIYLLQGRMELVTGELNQALTENPADPTAHGWLLNYHRFNGDYQRAQQEIDWLIQHWPRFWPAYLERGELLREHGDLTGAIRDPQRVLEQSANNVAALAALARAYLELGDRAKARETLDRARGDDRQNYGIRLQRALLLALDGNKTEATKEMDEGVQAYAAMQIYGPTLAADFYTVMGDADKALEWLDRAARMGDVREEYLRRNPMLTNLRGLPRFQQILNAVAYRRQQRPAL